MARAKQRPGGGEVTDDLLRDIVKDLNKELGDRGRATIMGDGLFAAEPKELLSTGVTTLDWAIGGGAPVGKLIELFGESQTGKSILGVQLLREAQRIGAITVLLDSEQAISIEFAKKLGGVNVDRIIRPEVESLESMFQAIDHQIDIASEKLAAAKIDVPIVILVDSLAGFPPQAELDSEMDEETALGIAAKIIRRAMRKLTFKIAEKRVLVMFTNHETANIKTGFAAKFAKKWTTYGGSGPRLWCSVRLRLQHKGITKKSGKEIGILVQATVIKTRFSWPMTKVQYPIVWSRGIDNEIALVDFLWSAHALGSTKGEVNFEDKKWKRAEFIAELRRDPELRKRFEAAGLALFNQMRDVVSGEPGDSTTESDESAAEVDDSEAVVDGVE